jgi:hypothetical protein
VCVLYIYNESCTCFILEDTNEGEEQPVTVSYDEGMSSYNKLFWYFSRRGVCIIYNASRTCFILEDSNEVEICNELITISDAEGMCFFLF